MESSVKKFAIPLSIASILMLSACSEDSLPSNPAAQITPTETNTPVDTAAPIDAVATTNPIAAENIITSGPAGGVPAALSCQSPDNDDDYPGVRYDALSYPVFDDYFDTTIQPADSAGLGVLFSGLAMVTTQLESILPGVYTAFCTYERYAEDQCSNSQVPVSDATLVAGVLSYTVSNASGLSEIKMVLNNPLYSSGSLQSTDEEGLVQNMIWSRDADGTERFRLTSNDGSSSEFIELPDCSGTTARVYMSDGELSSTTKASWTSPTAPNFLGTYEWCAYDFGTPGCVNFTRR